MRKAMATVAACATLLCAGAALAATPQDNCDYARITAWHKYRTCVDKVLAKYAREYESLDEYKAFWKCRHAYFKKWTGFKTKTSLAGSTCIGTRFTENTDQTVTDNLSGLVWEKKDDSSGIHDRDNHYGWTSGDGGPYTEDGTVFSTFLTGLNVAGFAGAKDWRLPTLAELQAIMVDFPCTGDGGDATCICTAPCVDPPFDAPEVIDAYLTATPYLPSGFGHWVVEFFHGYFDHLDFYQHVRAVRGGL